MPVGHSLQASCPLTSLYWPAGQETQGCPLGPVYPMLQTQAPCSRLPCSDVDPEGHIWHSLAARLSEYFPASHFKHSTSALPPCVGRYLPAGQLSHTEYEVAPIWIEYLPLAQLEQAFSALAPVPLHQELSITTTRAHNLGYNPPRTRTAHQPGTVHHLAGLGTILNRRTAASLRRARARARVRQRRPARVRGRTRSSGARWRVGR